MSFDDLLRQPPYNVPRRDRHAALLPALNQLMRHHADNCPAYARVLDGLWGGRRQADSLPEVPYLPVSLFKTNQLRSVPQDDVRAVLTSSGTSGQAVSQIAVDAETSRRQQKGLTNSLAHVLGPKRLPMLVIDTDAVFRNPARMNARGAGVLGMMRFGRGHAFALDEDLQPDLAAIRAFLAKNGDAPFFMFGFTFLVWSRFYEVLKREGLDLSNGILIHSGGWKKMVESAVDNAVFRRRFATDFNLHRIHNFYGMVEQLGSIFLEGPDGLLYPPNFSEVIIRDTQTLLPAPNGTPGIIQVISLIPHSYPGHSLLTEDMGVIEAEDGDVDGWNGAGLKVLGRVPRAELRGCSDVISQKLAA